MSVSASATDQGSILPQERAKASFDVEKMTYILDGGKKFTLRVCTTADTPPLVI